MVKTIVIDDKEVLLDNNIGWAFEYRDQFGRDIVPAIMPLLAGVVTVLGGIVEEVGVGKEVGVAEILQAVRGETLTEAMIQASQLELADFINIVWAFAKNADGSIPEPRRWVKQFETFPLDEIVPVVGELLFKGLASSKNQQRLQTMRESLKPKE